MNGAAFFRRIFDLKYPDFAEKFPEEYGWVFRQDADTVWFGYRIPDVDHMLAVNLQKNKLRRLDWHAAATLITCVSLCVLPSLPFHGADDTWRGGTSAPDAGSTACVPRNKGAAWFARTSSGTCTKPSPATDARKVFRE